MSKTDITMHSDSELSLMVFNDEWLYNQRHRTEVLIELIHSLFKFTAIQLNVLMDDIKNECE